METTFAGDDGPPRDLVVDALNFLTAYFLPIDAAPKGTSAWRLLEAMQSRVDGFVAACAATNLRPHFVIDAGYQSEEAATKWRKRREAEVRRHERAIPLSADTFLCDLLRAAGAPCYAAEGKDGDDIVARLAYELGPRSLILSADRDMFRYDFIRNAPDRVMADFYLRGDDPVLVALHPSPTGTPKDGVSFRTLKDVPTYEPDEWLHPHCKLHAVIHRPSHGYVRGACSPQTRRRGNLHGIARPLRLAAYALMGAMGEIHERYPEWDEAEDRVRWEEGEVEPHADSELRQMLVDGDKLAALRWLRDADDARRDGTDVDATREDGGNDFRAFARYAIVAELFAAIENDTTVLSNAREMRAATEATGHRGSRASSDWSDPFPPASRLALTCAACDGSYVVSAGEREFLKKKIQTPETVSLCVATPERSRRGKDAASVPARGNRPARGRGRGGERGVGTGTGEGKPTGRGRGRGGGRGRVDARDSNRRRLLAPPGTPRPSPRPRRAQETALADAMAALRTDDG